MLTYLDLGRSGQQHIVRVLQALLFELLGLQAHQQVEVGGQVAPQQRLVGGDVEQKSHGLHVKARLQNLRVPGVSLLPIKLDVDVLQCLGKS